MVYKYLSGDEGSIRAISDGTLKFTLFSDFNDPFETLPAPDPECNEKIKQRIRELVAANPLIDESTLTERFASGNHQTSEAAHQKTYLESTKQFGVFCLSRDPAQPLMWSHYANMHKGFCIGFNSSHPWFDPIESLCNDMGKDKPSECPDWLGKLKKVDYKPQRIVLDKKNWKEQFPSSFFWKADYWEYEAEERILFPLNFDYSQKMDSNNYKRFGMKVIRANKHLYLREFDKEMISEIVFGARCPLSTQSQIRKELEDYPIQYKFAIPSSVDFSVKIEKCLLNIPYDPLDPETIELVTLAPLTKILAEQLIKEPHPNQ